MLAPFGYALAGFIFAPLTCWMYNVATKYVGGLEVTVDTESEE